MFKDMHPESLFTFERLDLIIKYRFIEMVHHGIRDPFIDKLYTKHISERVGGAISLGKYPDGKRSVGEYADAFKSLYRNIKNNGYDASSVIKISEENGSPYPRCGAHRVSICKLLDLQIPTEMLVCKPLAKSKHWGIDSLKGSLSEEEINFTLYNYFYLKDNVRIFVIFPPAITHASQIKKQIGAHYNIKHELNLELNKKWQLKNLLREIYSYGNGIKIYKRKNCAISKKYNILKEGESYNFLILFTEEKPTKQGQDIKKEIRGDLHEFIDQKDFITIHASDSVEEKKSLLNVFLNENTLSHVKTVSEESESVDSLLKDYLAILEQYKIKDSVVVGSTPLDLFKLREATDIDFCLSEQERKEKGFNEKSKKLGKTTDIVTQNPNYCRGDISDYSLMNNPAYYFVYRGYKFASLKIMYAVKSVLNREKDKKDCLLIKNLLKGDG